MDRLENGAALVARVFTVATAITYPLLVRAKISP